MNQEEVEKTVNTVKAGLWEFPRIMIYMPFERALLYPEKVVDKLCYYASQGVHFIWRTYGRTDVSRNKAALDFLEAGYVDDNGEHQTPTHLLMLDQDHTHPSEILKYLGRWPMLDHNIHVVGGLNFMRQPPYKPCIYGQDEDKNFIIPTTWDPHVLMKVARIGTGSLLISRDVFETIEPPWFKYEYDGIWEDRWPGEDMYFSDLCRKYGFDMFVDPSCQSPHHTLQEVTEETFKKWYAEHGLDDSDGEYVG